MSQRSRDEMSALADELNAARRATLDLGTQLRKLRRTGGVVGKSAADACGPSG